MQFFDKLPESSVPRGPLKDWVKIKEDLKANPGQWGLVAENVTSTFPQQLREGRNKNFRGEEGALYEWSTRRPKNSDYAPRRTDLYGRYVGEAK